MRTTGIALHVDAPPPLVFERLAGFAWANAVSQVEAPDGQVGPGSVFVTRTRWLGAWFAIVMMVETWSPPSALTVTSVGARRLSFRGEYMVRPDGDGALVTMRLELQAQGVLRPLTALALRAAELRLRLGARRLQSMAERDPGDGFAPAAAG